MKNPFKKPGIPGAPTDANVMAKRIKGWLDSRPFHERERLVAATRTFGEIEVRLRFCKDGSQAFSVWLALPNSAEALQIIPSPVEQEAQHDGA